jgi:Ni2+-binding GTPase involved in maturation of urease and hydrogenase
MLTQDEANMLISSLKHLELKENSIGFPEPGGKLLLECKDGNNNKYVIDVVRGRLKPKKGTYQTRHNKATINETDLVQVLIDFFTYNNVSNRHEITIQGGDLVDGV